MKIKVDKEEYERLLEKTRQEVTNGNI